MIVRKPVMALVNSRPFFPMLSSSSRPAGQRVEDKVAWAKEILDLYAPA